MSPVSVISAAVVSGELVIGLSDGSLIQAGYVQGAAGPRGDRGGIGSTGQQGRDGLSVLSARGAPLSDLGKEGDFCIDVVSWKIYGPKSGANWGSGVMLRAPGAGTAPVGNDRELFGMAPQTLHPKGVVVSVSVTAPIINSGTATNPIIGATLAAVATTGEYSDLLSKPTLGTAAATDVTAYATAAQGTTADSAVQPGDLSTVATSGDYADLTNKPTLGTAAATASSDYATSAQGIKADTATQPGDLATVATSGSYNDLTNQPTLGTAAATNATAYATAVQGATADAASAAAASNTSNISSNTSDIATNTSDIATNTADIATKADLVNGVVPTSQIPAVALTQYLGTVANQAAMLALTGQEGDFCIRSDSSHTWVITGSNPASINDWIELVTPTSDVTSVNTQTGAVTLGASDVGAATTAQGTTADSAVQPGELALVATSGDYADLTNQPTLGTAAATASTAYATAAQGTKADSATQPGDLSTVAISGSYNDLSNKPSLGTAAATDATAYATAAQGALADSAVQSVSVTAPIVNNGTATDLALELGTIEGGSY